MPRRTGFSHTFFRGTGARWHGAPNYVAPPPSGVFLSITAEGGCATWDPTPRRTLSVPDVPSSFYTSLPLVAAGGIAKGSAFDDG